MQKLKDNKPTDLDHAIELLTSLFSESDLNEMRSMTEQKFMSSAHFGVGMAIRNAWELWWSEDTEFGWAPVKPLIVKWFNGIDIYHADDMSGIIMTSFYRSLAHKPRDIEGQLEVYAKHWLEQGFENGIFNNKRKR